MYKNCVSQSNFYRSEKEHLNGKIDVFNGLATLFEQFDKSGRVSFNCQAYFKNFELNVNDTTFLYFAHTETANHNNNSCSGNNYQKTTTD